MDLGLQGKHAIVTGGSLGIGKAIIARELDSMVAQAAAQLGGLHILVNSGRGGVASSISAGPMRATPPSCTSPRPWPSNWAAWGSRSTAFTPAVEQHDYAHDSPRGNAIGRMVNAAEIAYVAAFLASDKSWAISGELVVATGGAGRSVYYQG